MTDADGPANHRPGLPLAVVVGAGGMAMAIARRLGASHRVLLADRDREHLERQVVALRSEGHEVHGITCDVVEPDAVRQLAAAAERSGPVRALAHVVGLSPSMADGETVLRVNLVGPTLVADAFLELAGPGTAAVFVASLAGHLVELTPEQTAALRDPRAPDFPATVAAATNGELNGATAYQLSKAALVRMCRDRAAAWGTRGARIVSLSPGLIATPMGAREFAAQPEKRRLLPLTPLGREGTMVEIADAVEFLLSDRASFITGIDLLVDGGISTVLRP
ncbi:MAG TPA: SDR family oxidoreductase [Acidimicrobiia bacterium]|nr:SDR family oxidoreductase [Acidimicrobiia bacterium]